MKEFYFTPFCFWLNQHLEDNRNENSQKKKQAKNGDIQSKQDELSLRRRYV